MKYYLTLIIALVFVSCNAQLTNAEYESIDNAVTERAAKYKVHEETLRAVMYAYLERAQQDYEVETEKDFKAQGTIWQVTNTVASYMKKATSTKRNCKNNIECWQGIYFKYIDIVPEHTMVDKEVELRDTKKGFFKPVKTINIENPIVCKKDDPRSICKQLNDEEKKRADLENLYSERDMKKDLIKNILDSQLHDNRDFRAHNAYEEIVSVAEDTRLINIKIEKIKKELKE